MAVTLSTLSAAGFATTAAVRRVSAESSAEGPERPAGPSGDRGTVRWTGLAVLLLAACGFGSTIGFVVVGVTAGTAANGVPQLAGLVLGLWSVSSVVLGTAYQRSPWPRSLTVRLPLLLAAFGTVLLIPSFVNGVLPLAGAVVLAGATLVPQITAHNTLIDGLVPSRRSSEAYGWITTVIVVSNAGGQALSGWITQHYHYDSGFLTAAASALGLASPGVGRQATSRLRQPFCGHSPVCTARCA